MGMIKFFYYLATVCSSLIALNKNCLPRWLDSGEIINVDAQGCGTSLVQGPTGHK